jgi:hypothetical protein
VILETKMKKSKTQKCEEKSIAQCQSGEEKVQDRRHDPSQHLIFLDLTAAGKCTFCTTSYIHQTLSSPSELKVLYAILTGMVPSPKNYYAYLNCAINLFQLSIIS